MSSSRLLSELVKAVAVSKPKRDSWLIEELLDAFLVWDESVRVEKTRFPGVLLVLSEKLSPADISRLASKTGFSFMSRMVPAMVKLEPITWEEVEEALRDLVKVAGVGEIRAIIEVRGEGKGIASKTMIRDMLAKMGYRLASSARIVLSVESIDKLFIAALGEVIKCGYTCKLVRVH